MLWLQKHRKLQAEKWEVNLASGLCCRLVTAFSTLLHTHCLKPFDKAEFPRCELDARKFVAMFQVSSCYGGWLCVGLGCVLGSLSCVIQCRGFEPPQSLGKRGFSPFPLHSIKLFRVREKTEVSSKRTCTPSHGLKPYIVQISLHRADKPYIVQIRPTLCR